MLASACRFIVVHLLLLLLMASIGIGTLSAGKLFEQMPSFLTELPTFPTEMPSFSTEAPTQLPLRLEMVGNSDAVVVRHKAVLHPSTVASSRRRYNAECFFTPVNCHQFVRRTVFVTRPLLINSSTTATPKTTTADHFQRRRKGTHRKRTKHFRHKYV